MSDYVMVLHDNAIDTAEITPNATFWVLPLANLQDPQRSIVARSAGGGTTTIDITLPVDAQMPEAMALIDHNLSLGGLASIEAWNDAHHGLDLVYSTLDPIRSNFPDINYGAGLYGDGLFGGYEYVGSLSLADARRPLRPILMSQISLPAGASPRYWTINLTDYSLDYFQLGRLYLGPLWQPAVNYSWGSQRTREDRTPRHESRGGQYYGNHRAGRTILDFSFDWLSDTDRDQLWSIIMRLGQSAPVVLIQKPTSVISIPALYQQESTSFYGVFDQITLKQAFDGNASSPIKFMESL